MFADQYQGGAELTSEALVRSCPWSLFKVQSKNVSMKTLESGQNKHWIFGNFSQLSAELIPSIVANLSYSVLEYDYKFCKYRSTEKHELIENEPCNCSNEMSGKMISAFYFGAKSLWWMSEDQLNKYLNLFPFLGDKNNVVLSSVFDNEFFRLVEKLRNEAHGQERKGWIVLGSQSWIKGFDAAKEWCEETGKEYEVVWNLAYEEVLEKLSKAEGFVYLPQGGDTCPRMVIEAKLLGCKLHINSDVQHAKEIWFDTDDMFDTEAYLYAARERFWNGIKHALEWTPSLSGYMTTKDCISAKYPWKASITSMLGFCDEVVVVDGGSTDGTWEELEAWAAEEEKLKIDKVARDWSHPRFAVFDGQQKAEARDRCTKDFCWQQDADEVVHENDYEKISSIMQNFPAHINLISLPVTEYWGGQGKVRIDVNPWKWRLSRNLPEITHGIPGPLRKTDEAGDTYSALGSDGCDFIHRETLDLIPHANFYTQDAHNARVAALQGNEQGLEVYTDWFGRCVEMLPGVHHYSWQSLDRKIKTYRDYWSKHWQSLYDMSQEDTAENNMFFQRPWGDVSDEDIAELATELEEKMGGWVFHNPVDFTKPTPSMTVACGHPKIMRG